MILSLKHLIQSKTKCPAGAWPGILSNLGMVYKSLNTRLSIILPYTICVKSFVPLSRGFTLNEFTDL